MQVRILETLKEPLYILDVHFNSVQTFFAFAVHDASKTPIFDKFYTKFPNIARQGSQPQDYHESNLK